MIINWKGLTGCPADQLTHTENGMTLLLNKRTQWVKSYENLSYKWVDVELVENIQKDVPELCTPENYQIFLEEKGIRSRNRTMIEFQTPYSRQIIVALNKLSEYITISNYKEGFFFVDGQFTFESILQIPGVIGVRNISIIQRKEYAPTYLSTGVYLPSESISQLRITPRYNLARVAITLHSSSLELSPEGELLVGVFPTCDQTIIQAGEPIANLSSNEAIEFRREEDIYTSYTDQNVIRL